MLFDLLTAEEHLYLFSTIKGIPAHLRHEIVDRRIKEMGLEKYAKKVAGSYRGGNKRKL